MGIRRKIIKNVELKIYELSEDIAQLDNEYDLDEIDAKIKQLKKLEGIREKLKEKRIPKEVWVEIIKALAVMGLMGLAIAYDSRGRVLPKTIDKWIPGPRL